MILIEFRHLNHKNDKKNLLHHWNVIMRHIYF